MDTKTTSRRGTAEWVAERLEQVELASDWTASPATTELLDWLRLVLLRRARRFTLSSSDLVEVVQDATVQVLVTLDPSRRALRSASNPAAWLEHTAALAVTGAVRQLRMGGMGGVPTNGQHWHAPYPRRIGGELALQLIEQTPAIQTAEDDSVEVFAKRAAGWITEHIGVTLTPDALEGVMYVINRLRTVTRSAIVRGANSCLRNDPAFRHLGFSNQTASAFGVWLLGRVDAGHNAPSVLDAVVTGRADARTLARWRRVALDAGFATDDRAGHNRAADNRAGAPATGTGRSHGSGDVASRRSRPWELRRVQHSGRAVPASPPRRCSRSPRP